MADVGFEEILVVIVVIDSAESGAKAQIIVIGVITVEKSLESPVVTGRDLR